jgi:hypothetical protein
LNSAPRLTAAGGASAKAAGSGSKNNPQNITIIWRRMVFLMVNFVVNFYILIAEDSRARAPS